MVNIQSRHQLNTRHLHTAKLSVFATGILLLSYACSGELRLDTTEAKINSLDYFPRIRDTSALATTWLWDNERAWIAVYNTSPDSARLLLYDTRYPTAPPIVFDFFQQPPSAIEQVIPLTTTHTSTPDLLVILQYRDAIMPFQRRRRGREMFLFQYPFEYTRRNLVLQWPLHLEYYEYDTTEQNIYARRTLLYDNTLYIDAQNGIHLKGLLNKQPNREMVLQWDTTRRRFDTTLYVVASGATHTDTLYAPPTRETVQVRKVKSSQLDYHTYRLYRSDGSPLPLPDEVTQCLAATDFAVWHQGHLYYHHAARHEIVSYHLSTGRQQRLLSLGPGNEGCGLPVFSPDGQKMAIGVINFEEYSQQTRLYVWLLRSGAYRYYDVPLRIGQCQGARCQPSNYRFSPAGKLQYQPTTADNPNAPTENWVEVQ